MKILNLVYIAFLLVVISACGASQPVINNSPQQQAQSESDRLMAEKEHEIKMKLLEAKYAKEMAIAEGKIKTAKETVYQPCSEELQNTQTGVFSALGVANGKSSEHIAMSMALKSAQALIMTQYLGAFKKGVEEYTKDATGASGNNRDLAKLEGGVRSAGESAINKYVSVNCQRILQNDKGGYDAYVAISVSTEEVKAKIASKLETMEVDYNAEKLFNYINKELAARKQNAETIQ